MCTTKTYITLTAVITLNSAPKGGQTPLPTSMGSWPDLPPPLDQPLIRIVANLPLRINKKVTPRPTKLVKCQFQLKIFIVLLWPAARVSFGLWSRNCCLCVSVCLTPRHCCSDWRVETL